MMWNRIQIKNLIYGMKRYGWILLLKFAMEYSYINYLNPVNSMEYPIRFNLMKYIYGLIWMTVLFFGIRYTQKKSSSFFLQFYFIFQILPLTIIYALQDESTAYFSCICIASLLCEYIVLHTKSITVRISIFKIAHDNVIILAFIVMIAAFGLYVYELNGFPTIMALDFSRVYELRHSNIYQIGKYGQYIQDISIKVVIPILLTVFFFQKKYFLTLFVIILEALLYLYTGHKAFLFTGFLVLVAVYYGRKNFLVDRFLIHLSVVFSFLCIFSHTILFHWPYTLFVRRILFLNAKNSFHYYDFFSSHPKIGFSGIVPRWIIDFERYYGNGYPEGYTYQIGAIYYNRPIMDVTNGFLSEGFLHFDFMGIFLNLILFAIFLKLIDGLQRKTCFAFAVGCCINVIFLLGEAHLMGEIFSWIGVWLAFLVLYQGNIIFQVQT